MFRRFVPRTAVTAVGAQFAFASRRSSSSSAKAPSVSDIKASNKQAALAALSSDIGSDAKQSFDYSGAKKKDLHMPSPSTVNPETISTKSAYSQSLGFNSSIDDNADGKLNKDVSGTEFDRKVYGKSVKSSGSNDKAASKSSGAASHTGPQVATKTKDEEQKMDYEGAMRPATAGQMHSDKKVETNYDIHKKAQHNNQAAASSKVALSDAPINKDANEDKHDYNAHNLPPTPLQELGSAISNMAGRLFHSKDSSSKDQSDSKSSGAASHTGPQVATKTRDEEQKMDWEGAMRPATASQMHSDKKVETNYDIHKKAQHEHSSQRISSSSGESQQSSLKSNNNNASRNTESPTFTVYGNYTPQAASHEAYATSSMGTSHETADSYNKKLRNASENDKHPTTIQEISSKAANATGLSNLTDGVSSVTGGFFTRGSDAYPQYAGAQIQPTAYHAGKPLHTEPQDANPLVGDSSSEGKSAHSANADNFNLSSLKKEAPTDYSSPDYLVRRT